MVKAKKKNPNQALLQTALEYAERGWAVFQLRERKGKLLPLSKAKDGGPRWDATTDPDEIKQRWTKSPDAGIGIATGKESGLLVVDVDSNEGHGVDGLASMKALTEKHGALPETAMAVTPSGGRHIYFKYPVNREIKNGVSLIAKGIDHRGNGGFIVAPPSVRDDGDYTWCDPLGLLEIADSPEWLLGLMEKPKLSDRAKSSSSSQTKSGKGWSEAALSGEIAKLCSAPEGQRNHQLNTCAFNLGQIIAGCGLDKANVERELTATAENIGLERTEIEATIKGGIEAGMKIPRTPPKPPRDYEELMAASKDLTGENIEETEEIISESAGLNPIEQDMLFRSINSATGITLGVLRKQFAKTRDGGENPDHLELARMTLGHIGAKNIIHANDMTWKWTGDGVWRQNDDRSIRQMVQGRISSEVDVYASTVSGVSDVLKSEINRPSHTFNVGNPETVNCMNGELELKDGKWHLGQHCREHYRTTQIPVAYEPNAKAPLFEAFLEQVFRDDPDKDNKKSALLELIGYTLMSHARHELFVMLIGPGANGKSVLLGVLEELCGSENVAGVQPSSFENRFQRAHLHEKLANIVTELRQGEVIADAELKAITSGEPATVEHKFKNPFVMRPFATCWFGTNHMPDTRDVSAALFRRTMILQFNRTFTKDEQDPLLREKLVEELPGILNLALNAYARALDPEIGFSQPASSKQAKQEWKVETDHIAQFVEDECEVDAGAEEQMEPLFEHYKSWASVNDIARPISLKDMRGRLTRLGYGKRIKNTGKFVTGIRLKPQKLNGFG